MERLSSSGDGEAAAAVPLVVPEVPCFESDDGGGDSSDSHSDSDDDDVPG